MTYVYSPKKANLPEFEGNFPKIASPAHFAE
jgi:hypothetical protein